MQFNEVVMPGEYISRLEKSALGGRRDPPGAESAVLVGGMNKT